jgi:hypothetical protein
MSEFDIYGVFVPGLLVFGILGAIATALLRRLLLVAGVYRFVWHPALFDIALFIIAVGAIFIVFNIGNGNVLPILGSI